jgi:hypothetical protein
MHAKWPKRLPKRYAEKSVLSVKEIAEIGHIGERSVQRFYIREFPNAIKLGTAFNAQYAIPTSDVVAFLERVHGNKKDEPVKSTDSSHYPAP